MSPFYAAYLRQLHTPPHSKQSYADGGTVTTLGAQPSPTDLRGPTTLAGNTTTGGSNMANTHREISKNLSGPIGGTDVMDIGHTLGIGPSASGLTDSILNGLSNQFQAQAAPIQAGTNVDQLNNAYNRSQASLDQQQNLTNALAAQNGIGNQTNVYDQYANIAAGNGPNPALEMLRQQTGQNVAQQASLMASSRGAGANPAAVARQAANQGAAIQQNAVGQGAALQAQQQQSALANMGNIANTQVANQMQGVQGLNNAAQNQQQILQNANAAYNANLVNQQNAMNQVNAATAAGNQNAAGQVFGGIMNAASSVASMFSDERGKENIEDADFDIDKFIESLSAEPQKMAEGGQVQAVVAPVMAPTAQVMGPQSSAGQWLNSGSDMAVSSAPGGYTPPEQSDWFQSKDKGGGGGLADMFGGKGGANIADGAGGGASGGMGMPMKMSGVGMAKGGEVGEMVDNLEPKAYDYKNPSQPGAAEGRQYGIMAQDLEKSKAGASIVKETPQGKMVDVTHGLGLALAAIGHLNNKIKALEGKKMAEGGQVDAMLSPGERYIPPKDVRKIKAGAHPMSVGRTIPGKPKVGGATDNYDNDTVPAKLQEGGVVLPRSVTQSPDAAKKADIFVEAIFMGKPSLKKGKK